jgi:hypothetical protein
MNSFFLQSSIFDYKYSQEFIYHILKKITSDFCALIMFQKDVFMDEIQVRLTIDL